MDHGIKVEHIGSTDVRNLVQGEQLGGDSGTTGISPAILEQAGMADTQEASGKAGEATLLPRAQCSYKAS